MAVGRWDGSGQMAVGTNAGAAVRPNSQPRMTSPICPSHTRPGGHPLMSSGPQRPRRVVHGRGELRLALGAISHPNSQLPTANSLTAWQSADGSWESGRQSADGSRDDGGFASVVSIADCRLPSRLPTAISRLPPLRFLRQRRPQVHQGAHHPAERPRPEIFVRDWLRKVDGVLDAPLGAQLVAQRRHHPGNLGKHQ